VEFVNDTQAYEDALQAYQEYHPLQDRFYDTPADPRTDGERQLYRSQSFGSDAALFMLDSRSFRDAQLPPADLADPTQFLVDAFDPSRTLLGRAQVELLKQDLLAAEENGVTWKFVTIPEPIQNFGVVNAEDRFEGYAAERTETLKFIDDNDIDNVVFMAGDFHGTIVNNLTYQEGPGQEQIATNAFEVVTGPVAFFDGRFGPNVANLSAAAGFIGPEELAFYDSLPVAPDADDALNDKDDFIKQLLIGQTDLFGYDPVGLNNNLEFAEGLIDATLLQGDYLSAHTYSWTEFDIASDSQKLLVTTYGIDAYSEADVLANPEAVLGLTPTIVSQFEVTPQDLGTDSESDSESDSEITPPTTTEVLTQIESFEAPFGAEILAFDPTRQALYVVSGGNELQVLDASDPANLSLLFAIDLETAAGVEIGGANSVAYQDGLLAVAIEAPTVTNPGVVALVNLDTFADDPIGSVNALPVGALPDMVTFSPDGTRVLVANEGEPDEGIDPDGSVSIIDISDGIQAATVQTADFTAFNGREADLRGDGVRIFPDASASQDFEPEYIAVSPDSTTAYVTLQENNAVAIVDIATATVQGIVPLGLKDFSKGEPELATYDINDFGQVEGTEGVQLGIIDFPTGNTLDASDRDGGINLQNWHVFGLKMPDSIGAYEYNGVTYFVTANEGDDRGDADEDARGDAIRLGDLGDVTSFGRDGLSLDESLDPALTDDENLGRLTISSIDGDTDGDGDIDQITAYGGRSFSIYDELGNLVYDSGDDFEKFTAALTPDLFNANDGDPAEFDNRSDNKGPEPEALTLGTINGRTLAFVGLERAGGGVMVYDITNPAESTFLQYIRSDEDIAPEGLTFVPAEDSPSGIPLLVVANEVSSTVAVYTIKNLIVGEEASSIHLISSDLDDAIIGLGDSNFISGLEGNDSLPGNSGDDTLKGQGGNDRLVGGDGSDVLLGGDVSDVILGGAGDDSIQGGAGYDLITGGPGSDAMVGGAGADIFIYESLDDAGDTIRLFELGSDKISIQPLLQNSGIVVADAADAMAQGILMVNIETPRRASILFDGDGAAGAGDAVELGNVKVSNGSSADLSSPANFIV
jgi:hypothetical protein